MKKNQIFVGALLVGLLVILAAGPGLAQDPGPQGSIGPQAAMGTAFTYQGRLADAGGPVGVACDFEFSLWDAAGSGEPPSGGNQIGATQSRANVGVSDGLFTIPDLDFGGTAFTGEARWLQIAVRCPTGSGSHATLAPRQALTPAPYALALPGLWTQQTATSANLVGGYSGNQVAGGVYAATIAGGGSSDMSCGADLSRGTAALPCLNEVTGEFASVGGGGGNIAGSWATVGGGDLNNAAGLRSTIAGGRINAASGYQSTVGGGGFNTASGQSSTVGGGSGNTATNTSSTVGGGVNNSATNLYASVAGGDGNVASGERSSVGGGSGNVANDIYATVGGGLSNTAGDSATVGGGIGNMAGTLGATIGGGGSNLASGTTSTIGGGASNVASGGWSAIGGGATNSASGDLSMVPGGKAAVASHYGEMAHAGGAFASDGDAQTSVYVLRRATSGTTPAELFLDGSARRLTIASGRTATVDVLLVARSSSGASMGCTFQGVIYNTGGTTAFVMTPGKVCHKGGLTWDANLVADDANDALQILVTGAAGTDIRWVARVQTAEVSY